MRTRRGVNGGRGCAPLPDEAPASLDAHIRIVHGDAMLADSSAGEAAMCDRFEGWVREHYTAPAE